MARVKKITVGVITDIDTTDHSASVQIKNRPYPYINVDASRQRSLAVGDNVIIGFHDNNKHLPFIISKSASRTNSVIVPLIIAANLWSQSRCTCYGNPAALQDEMTFPDTVTASYNVPDRMVEQSETGSPYTNKSFVLTPNAVNSGYNTGTWAGTALSAIMGTGATSIGCSVGAMRSVSVNTTGQYLIVNNGYSVTCLNGDTGAVKWTHTIAGFTGMGGLEESENWPAWSEYGDASPVGTAINDAPVEAFACTKDYIVLLVRKISGMINPNFWESDGETMNSWDAWMYYDSVESYLYLIDYRGNFVKTIPLHSERFKSFFFSAADGCWGYGNHTIYGNPDPLLADGFFGLEQSDIHVGIPNPNWSGLNFGDPGWVLYDENGIDVGDKTIGVEGVAVTPGTIFTGQSASFPAPNRIGGVLNSVTCYNKWWIPGTAAVQKTTDSFSTRSAYSPISVHQEAGVDVAYIAMSAALGDDYDSAVQEILIARVPLVAGTVTKQYVYLDIGISTPYMPLLWDEVPASYGDSAYNLVLFRRPDGAVAIWNPTDNVLYTHDVAVYRRPSMPFMLAGGGTFLWCEKNQGDWWAISVLSVGRDGHYIGDWVGGIADGVIEIGWFNEDKSKFTIIGSKSSTGPWFSYTYNGDWTATLNFYEALDSVALKWYTDGHKAYAYTAAGMQAYNFDGSTGDLHAVTFDTDYTCDGAPIMERGKFVLRATRRTVADMLVHQTPQQVIMIGKNP